jgi:hypothetical protein
MVCLVVIMSWGQCIKGGGHRQNGPCVRACVHVCVSITLMGAPDIRTPPCLTFEWEWLPIGPFLSALCASSNLYASVLTSLEQMQGAL